MRDPTLYGANDKIYQVNKDYLYWCTAKGYTIKYVRKSKGINE